MVQSKKIESELVWGAAAIGEVIGRTQRSTYHLLVTGALPAQKANDLWVAERSKLRDPSCWPGRHGIELSKPRRCPAEAIGLRKTVTSEAHDDR